MVCARSICHTPGPLVDLKGASMSDHTRELTYPAVINRLVRLADMGRKTVA
jgi:hypothetical protein